MAQLFNLLKNVYDYLFNINFLGPYSPFQNAIEETFAIWKYFFREEQEKTEDNIIKVLTETSLKI